MDAAAPESSAVPSELMQTGEPFTDKAVNTIRFLAVDAVEKAQSGHPGMPMGMAPTAFALWDRHLRFNPANPSFVNRDRFVLSAGHGSMLIYSLLYLYGFASVSLEDIQQFRQLNSATPGHPESNDTPGVEVTTGPLGQGICNAVGMAIAEAHAAATYNTDDFTIIDNFTYCIMGDGCVMEGMSAEACSLAGHLKLGKLIALYDDNSISIGTSILCGCFRGGVRAGQCAPFGCVCTWWSSTVVGDMVRRGVLTLRVVLLHVLRWCAFFHTLFKGCVRWVDGPGHV